MKIAALKPKFVEVIPDNPEEGILYICERYHTATHRCCCGCRKEVVTPLSPAAWQIRRRSNSVSLYPSIGNWNFPCRSHYWIQHNRVLWAGQMSKDQIKRVEQKDRAALEQYVDASNRAAAPQRRRNDMSLRDKVWAWICAWFN